MAIKKKNNSRKALAVALGIMGVAGLSMASASQLTIDPSNEVAVGTDVFASCDDAVAVSYDYAANASAATSGYGITDVVISGIEAGCSGQDITIILKDAADNTLFTSTPTAISGTSFTYTATSNNIDIATDLGDVTVIIG